MSTRTFSQRNRTRCESPNGFNHRLESWSLSDWATALCGEVGEMCDTIKKLNRIRDGIPGNTKTQEELLENFEGECADIYIYLDLLVQAAGFHMEDIVERKFAKTNQKIGYTEEE